MYINVIAPRLDSPQRKFEVDVKHDVSRSAPVYTNTYLSSMNIVPKNNQCHRYPLSNVRPIIRMLCMFTCKTHAPKDD